MNPYMQDLTQEMDKVVEQKEFEKHMLERAQYRQNHRQALIKQGKDIQAFDKQYAQVHEDKKPLEPSDAPSTLGVIASGTMGSVKTLGTAINSGIEEGISETSNFFGDILSYGAKANIPYISPILESAGDNLHDFGNLAHGVSEHYDTDNVGGKVVKVLAEIGGLAALGEGAVATGLGVVGKYATLSKKTQTLVQFWGANAFVDATMNPETHNVARMTKDWMKEKYPDLSPVWLDYLADNDNDSNLKKRLKQVLVGMGLVGAYDIGKKVITSNAQYEVITRMLSEGFKVSKKKMNFLTRKREEMVQLAKEEMQKNLEDLDLHLKETKVPKETPPNPEGAIATKGNTFEIQDIPEGNGIVKGTDRVKKVEEPQGNGIVKGTDRSKPVTVEEKIAKDPLLLEHKVEAIKQNADNLPKFSLEAQKEAQDTLRQWYLDKTTMPTDAELRLMGFRNREAFVQWKSIAKKTPPSQTVEGTLKEKTIPDGGIPISEVPKPEDSPLLNEKEFKKSLDQLIEDTVPKSTTGNGIVKGTDRVKNVEEPKGNGIVKGTDRSKGAKASQGNGIVKGAYREKKLSPKAVKELKKRVKAKKDLDKQVDDLLKAEEPTPKATGTPNKKEATIPKASEPTKQPKEPVVEPSQTVEERMGDIKAKLTKTIKKKGGLVPAKQIAGVKEMRKAVVVDTTAPQFIKSIEFYRGEGKFPANVRRQILLGEEGYRAFKEALGITDDLVAQDLYRIGASFTISASKGFQVKVDEVRQFFGLIRAYQNRKKLLETMRGYLSFGLESQSFPEHVREFFKNANKTGIQRGDLYRAYSKVAKPTPYIIGDRLITIGKNGVPVAKKLKPNIINIEEAVHVNVFDSAFDTYSSEDMANMVKNMKKFLPDNLEDAISQQVALDTHVVPKGTLAPKAGELGSKELKDKADSLMQDIIGKINKGKVLGVGAIPIIGSLDDDDRKAVYLGLGVLGAVILGKYAIPRVFRMGKGLFEAGGKALLRRQANKMAIDTHRKILYEKGKAYAKILKKGGLTPKQEAKIKKAIASNTIQRQLLAKVKSTKELGELVDMYKVHAEQMMAQAEHIRESSAKTLSKITNPDDLNAYISEVFTQLVSEDAKGVTDVAMHTLHDQIAQHLEVIGKNPKMLNNSKHVAELILEGEEWLNSFIKTRGKRLRDVGDYVEMLSHDASRGTIALQYIIGGMRDTILNKLNKMKTMTVGTEEHLKLAKEVDTLTNTMARSITQHKAAMTNMGQATAMSKFGVIEGADIFRVSNVFKHLTGNNAEKTAETLEAMLKQAVSSGDFKAVAGSFKDKALAVSSLVYYFNMLSSLTSLTAATMGGVLKTGYYTGASYLSVRGGHKSQRALGGWLTSLKGSVSDILQGIRHLDSSYSEELSMGVKAFRHNAPQTIGHRRFHSLTEPTSAYLGLDPDSLIGRLNDAFVSLMSVIPRSFNYMDEVISVTNKRAITVERQITKAEKIAAFENLVDGTKAFDDRVTELIDTYGEDILSQVEKDQVSEFTAYQVYKQKLNKGSFMGKALDMMNIDNFYSKILALMIAPFRGTFTRIGLDAFSSTPLLRRVPMLDNYTKHIMQSTGIEASDMAGLQKVGGAFVSLGVLLGGVGLMSNSYDVKIPVSPSKSYTFGVGRADMLSIWLGIGATAALYLKRQYLLYGLHEDMTLGEHSEEMGKELINASGQFVANNTLLKNVGMIMQVMSGDRSAKRVLSGMAGGLAPAFFRDIQKVIAPTDRKTTLAFTDGFMKRLWTHYKALGSAKDVFTGKKIFTVVEGDKHPIISRINSLWNVVSPVQVHSVETTPVTKELEKFQIKRWTWAKKLKDITSGIEGRSYKYRLNAEQYNRASGLFGKIVDKEVRHLIKQKRYQQGTLSFQNNQLHGVLSRAADYTRAKLKLEYPEISQYFMEREQRTLDILKRQRPISDIEDAIK